jgi:predicted nucleotidyltransferase component of viral defense system
MIPQQAVIAWRKQAPWSVDSMVEQDLVISRALVELFDHPRISESLAFRGGSALYKLHMLPSARYSEDIDLVQIRAERAQSSRRAPCRVSRNQTYSESIIAYATPRPTGHDTPVPPRPQ